MQSQSPGGTQPTPDGARVSRTFDDVVLGDQASVTRTFAQRDLDLFAAMSGDTNPVYWDASRAATGHAAAHGAWTSGLISAVLGTKLPGAGTVYLGQHLCFHRSVLLGDTVTVTLTAREKRPATGAIVFACRGVNQRGEEVVTGTAEVVAPAQRIASGSAELPDVEVHRHDRYRSLLERCRELAPLTTAVVHPCDAPSLVAAIDAADAHLITPVFVGPENRIRSIAATAGRDVGQYRIVSAPHSHAAAAQAAAMAATGEVGALMKGSLHTDELMHAVLDTPGLHSGRRVSHVFVMDVPTYARQLLITDAAVNIAPTLEEKRDICQNAIDLAHVLGVETPKVAVLAAVETVSEKMRSTLDAAALSKMAERGQITGAVVDGPLAFDTAVSHDAARIKGITSPVAGEADILLVPDIEAGNMLAKQLSFFAGADTAGVVLGARVPIILTSRADTLAARLASCAIALLISVSRDQPEGA